MCSVEFTRGHRDVFKLFLSSKHKESSMPNTNMPQHGLSIVEEQLSVHGKHRI